MRSKIYPFLIVLICLYLIFQNYTSGTFLSGWDTLHPEFDFALNIKRAVFGVFRQEQGLGAVAGHSHMSDLPRIIFLYISSFVLPVNFLRYFYFFVTLLIGPLGVYFFLERVVFKDKEKNQKEILAFLGSLFYLLNLGTLQHFYVPFEMFATLYGFLPWLFLFASKYLIEDIKTRKYLILFCIFSLLATPMAYAATLWFVYFISLVIYTITLFSFGPRSRLKLKRLIVLFLVTIAINSYWLLPNIYFIKNHSADVLSSKINQDFSAEAYADDTKYANLENVSILRGFLFDWKEYKDNKSDYLLKSWRNYLQNPFIVVLGTTFFGIIVFGLFISVATKDKLGLVFLPVFSFAFIFLIHNQPPLNQIFDFVRDRSTVFSEALRFPWTKFSIIAMFSYAFYFSKGIAVFMGIFKNAKVVRLAFGLIVSAALVIWMLPAFSGQLISPSMRINIPSDYFNTFNYFAGKPEDQRIAVFPVSSFRGWEYYNWGFQGAGFIWFGLKQPVLVRDFDRWNPNNEDYYWEISYAVYSKNLTSFENVLQKYQISYLLVDESSINPAFPKSAYTDELESLLSASTNISRDQSFGKVKIYRVNLSAPVNNFVYLENNLALIGPVYKWTNLDKTYQDFGDYISSDTGSLYYPFRSLFTGKAQSDLEFVVEERSDSFIFKKVLPKGEESYFLEIPQMQAHDLEWVDPNDLSNIKDLSKNVFFDGKSVEVTIPKVGGLFSSEIELGDKNEFLLPNLPHNLSYLITVPSKNISGQPLKFWIENLTSKRPDLETYLPAKSAVSYFIQPPMAQDGLGYTLHFDDVLFGNQPAKNELGKIKIYPIPFNFLTSLVLKKQNISSPEMLTTIKVDHPNPSTYYIETPLLKGQNNTLVLSQSFDKGWKAYSVKGKTFLNTAFPFIFGKELKNHVLVNNWENGWAIEASGNPNQKIVIIYIPQYLEFFGMLLPIVCIGMILMKRRRS